MAELFVERNQYSAHNYKYYTYYTINTIHFNVKFVYAFDIFNGLKEKILAGFIRVFANQYINQIKSTVGIRVGLVLAV